MSIRARLESLKNTPERPHPLHKVLTTVESRTYHELKSRIHQKLLERVDLAVMESMSQEKLADELKTLVERLLIEETVVLNEIERRMLVRDIQHEMLGLGPLELLMADPTVSDILVNTLQPDLCRAPGPPGAHRCHVSPTTSICCSIIDKIVSRVGRRIDESSPMVDARLPDGSRVNAVIPPVALDGPMMSIRRFAVDAAEDGRPGQADKSLTPDMACCWKALPSRKST